MGNSSSTRKPELVSWILNIRNGTGSKSGSPCEMAIKDIKTKRKKQRIRGMLLSLWYIGRSCGSLYQVDEEESNLMFVRSWIKETVMTMPLFHAKKALKTECPSVIVVTS